jgi:hypothetical protein
MANNVHMSVASWNLALNAALDTPLNGGFMEIYDSTGAGQPATPDVAVTTQVKLAKLALSATAFAAAASGVKTANAITSAAALATGTATWFRLFKSDDATAVLDGTVGTSGTDCVLNDVNITTGGTVSVTSLTVSMPAAQ